ncbi:MAG: thiamine phosphate synthase [Planctomycetota bacterium]|nr:thiamine phosphate synthase [Planctomycetota bacterium]
MKTKPLSRILDANANRAREGIRTAEDFIRFEIQEPRWSRRLKELRHRVTEHLTEGGLHEALVAARNVETDSGKPDGTSDAQPKARVEHREDGKAVAQRGLKRAQEALRVLEEYLRGPAHDTSRALAKVRFELYEAEQWLVQGSAAARILRQARLYVLIAEDQCARGVEATARAVLKGGATVLQMREKALDGHALLERARMLGGLCGEYGALFVVNDRADVALAAGAGCVHLGQKDLPVGAVRRMGGAGLLIGRSTHSEAQARAAVQEDGADYIAVGSMYATETKKGYELKGPALAKAVMDLKLEVPVFAIGGISKDRIGELRAVGVKGIAVSSAVVTAPDPERAARELVEALEA